MSLSNVRKAAALLLVLVFWVMTLPAGAHPTLPQAVTTPTPSSSRTKPDFPNYSTPPCWSSISGAVLTSSPARIKLTSFWSSLVARMFALFPTENFPAPPV